MSKKGFTLIELVVVIGIIVLFCGFSIVTIATIPQVRMKTFVTDVKSYFELARDFSKTHGGTISLYIERTDDGLELRREVRESNQHSDYQIKAETKTIEDNKIELFYQKTNENSPRRLGDDGKNVLEFQFSQTDGRIIGPDFVDYMTISNGNKTYKLIVMQASGQVYFDYELKDDYVEKNEGAAATKISVSLPCFIDKHNPQYDPFYMPDNPDLTTLQPPIQYDSRYVKISGVYRASEPKAGGMYVIYFDLKDPNSCQWELNNVPSDPSEYTSTKILEWNIVK